MVFLPDIWCTAPLRATPHLPKYGVKLEKRGRHIEMRRIIAAVAALAALVLGGGAGVSGI